MKKLFSALLLLTSLGAQAQARRIVDAYSDDGYATAYCPAGYRVERCDIDYGNCDKPAQGGYYCQADSRNHRLCRVRANCIENIRRVRIPGFTNDGYREISCPAGMRVERCNFDTTRCDGLRQGRYSCGADSRRWQNCYFEGICVTDRWF